jgi:hypothetical protein
VVPVHIRGGASQVRIRQPAGVPVQLRVGSGVADLRFDEQEWGAVGGGLRLATPEATQVPDRFEIQIASGPPTWRSADLGSTQDITPHLQAARRARTASGGTEAELQGLTTNRKWES